MAIDFINKTTVKYVSIGDSAYKVSDQEYYGSIYDQFYLVVGCVYYCQ